MTKMSVKEYADLIGKNEKTVYKMIKSRSLNAVKEDGKYRVTVDKNLIKVIERAQQALNEAKAILLSIEQASDQIKRPIKAAAKKESTEKNTAKALKNGTKPPKKSAKKSDSIKTAAKKNVQKKSK